MNGKEVSTKTVELSEINEEIFDHVTKFLYLNEFTFTVNDALEVAKAAQYFQLDDLKNSALEFLEKERTNLTTKQLIDNISELTSSDPSFLPKDSILVDQLWLALINEPVYRLRLFLYSEPFEFIEMFVQRYGKSAPFTCCQVLESWATKEKKEFKSNRQALLSYIDFEQMDALSLATVAATKLIPYDRSLSLLKQNLTKKSEGSNEKMFEFEFKEDGVKEFVYKGVTWKLVFNMFRSTYFHCNYPNFTAALSSHFYKKIADWRVRASPGKEADRCVIEKNETLKTLIGSRGYSMRLQINVI